METGGCIWWLPLVRQIDLSLGTKGFTSVWVLCKSAVQKPVLEKKQKTRTRVIQAHIFDAPSWNSSPSHQSQQAAMQRGQAQCLYVSLLVLFACASSITWSRECLSLTVPDRLPFLTKDIALSLNILEVVTKPIFSPALPKPEKSQTSCPLCQCVFGILTQETYLHLLRNTHPLDFNTVP